MPNDMASYWSRVTIPGLPPAAPEQPAARRPLPQNPWDMAEIGRVAQRGAWARAQLPPALQRSPAPAAPPPGPAAPPPGLPNPLGGALRQFGGRVPTPGEWQGAMTPLNVAPTQLVYNPHTRQHEQVANPEHARAMDAVNRGYGDFLGGLLGGHAAATQRAGTLADVGLRSLSLLGVPGAPGELERRGRELNVTEAQAMIAAALAGQQMGRGNQDRIVEALLAGRTPPAQIPGQLQQLRAAGVVSGGGPNDATQQILGLALNRLGGGQGPAAPPAGVPHPDFPSPPQGGLAAPGVPVPSQAGPAPGVAPVAQYAGIQGLLDQYSGVQRNEQGVAPGRRQSNDIGTFLRRLDQSHPGFVRQNWPAIRQYLVDVWGEPALVHAGAGTTATGQTPMGEYWTDNLTVPVVGEIVRGFGSLPHVLGAQPSEEILGRNALNALLREQGQAPRINQGALLPWLTGLGRLTGPAVR